MTTLRIAQLDTGDGFDLVLGDGLLETDDGLETAVILSLFTDAAASAEELAAYGFTADQNRGWWADDYPDTEADILGSKLWLLERAKHTPEALADAALFTEQALTWMVEDEVARSVAASAAWHKPTGYLRLAVEITRADGTRWLSQWNATAGLQLEAA